MPKFADYKSSARRYITVQERDFYPEYLGQAVTLYSAVFERFGEMLATAATSADLLRTIMREPNPMRIQLLRIFRKCLSPDTPVEMLKVVRHTEETIDHFGEGFADIIEARNAWLGRPHPDEALAAILWEHHDRGTRGYELTDQFFEWFELNFGDDYMIIGPRRAGTDVQLDQRLPNFIGNVPADFIIARKIDRAPLVVGFAHYDSDRGGSQEDDRTAGNQDKVQKIMRYASEQRIGLKVLFVNDGPGLLLGSMWDDYSALEEDNEFHGEQRVRVSTFTMLEERLTKEWMEQGAIRLIP